MNTGPLGLGIYRHEPAAVPIVIAAGARVVLLFGEALRLAAEIKRQAPWITIIGRGYIDDTMQRTIVTSGYPEQSGYNWGLDLCVHYPAVDVWQGLNESTGRTDEVLLRGTVAFDLGVAEACHGAGKSACVLNLASGSYPTDMAGDDQRWFLPGFVTIVRPLLEHPGVRFLGMHAYSGGSRDRMSVSPEWYSLRYRALVAALKAAGVRVPPVVFTEFGQGSGFVPWLSDDEAWADFAWWGEQIAGDADVFGATYFCLYRNDDTWGAFDIAGTTIPGRFGAWNAAHTVEDAPDGGTMPMTRNESWLLDMWARQGVKTIKRDSAEWLWMVARADEGRVFIPMPSPDGSWQNWSTDSEYVLCYTLPTTLYFKRGEWIIREGMPPLPKA